MSRGAAKRIGRAAISGDPWAAHIRQAVFGEYHPPQAAAASDPSKLKTVLTGRGGGKTTLLKGVYLTSMAETPNGKFLYACPTLGMAIELLWEPLKQSCSQLGITEDVTFTEAPREGGKILTFNRTGSRLKLFGADDAKQINLCRGQPFDGVGGDEVGFWPIDLVDNFVRKVIMPRIGERDGWILLASSPGRDPRGFFYDRTRDGSPLHRPYAQRNQPEHAGWQGWSSHAWNLAEIVKLRGAETRYPALCALRRSHVHIKNNVEKWGDQNPIWLREYEGRWARDNTASVFQFDPTRNLWRPAGEQHGVTGLALLKASLAALPKDVGEWHHVVSIDKGSPRVSKDASNENASDARERRDPWAVNVYSFAPADPLRRLMHTCFFPERTGLYARPIAQMMLGEDEKSPTGCKSHEKPGGVFGLIGWPDAMVMDADSSTIEELSNVYGLRFKKAEKKPEYKAGAIELVNGDMVDARIKLIEDSPAHKQVAELQWAEQESGALKEDPSQPNHCFIAGTLVETDRGAVPIEQVTIRDRVWTRTGLRAVLWSGSTGTRETVRVEFSNDSVLVGTRNHPVWTETGWKNLADLTRMDTVAAWESTDQASSSRSEERSTADTPRPPTPPCAGTSPRPTESFFIGPSGLLSAGSSLRDSMSTTRTATTPTTGSRTSSQSTVECISASTDESPSGKRCRGGISSSTPFPPPPIGIDHPRAAHGTPPTHERRPAADLRLISASARSAIATSSPRTAVEGCAARRAWPRHTAIACGLREVFDLTVEGEPEFFANGVLVHNSSDTLIYGRREVANLYDAGVVATEDAPGETAISYADPMGLGDDDLTSGADDAFAAWGGETDDWGT